MPNIDIFIYTKYSIFCYVRIFNYRYNTIMEKEMKKIIIIPLLLFLFSILTSTIASADSKVNDDPLHDVLVQVDFCVSQDCSVIARASNALVLLENIDNSAEFAIKAEPIFYNGTIIHRGTFAEVLLPNDTIEVAVFWNCFVAEASFDIKYNTDVYLIGPVPYTECRNIYLPFIQGDME